MEYTDNTEFSLINKDLFKCPVMSSTSEVFFGFGRELSPTNIIQDLGDKGLLHL